MIPTRARRINPWLLVSMLVGACTPNLSAAWPPGSTQGPNDPPKQRTVVSCTVDRDECVNMTGSTCSQYVHVNFTGTTCGDPTQGSPCGNFCPASGQLSTLIRGCTSKPTNLTPSSLSAPFCDRTGANGAPESDTVTCTQAGRKCTSAVAGACVQWDTNETVVSRSFCIDSRMQSAFQLCQAEMAEDGTALFNTQLSVGTYTRGVSCSPRSNTVTSSDVAYGISPGLTFTANLGSTPVNLTTSGGRMIVTYSCDHTGEFCIPYEVKDFELALNPATIQGYSLDRIQIQSSGPLGVSGNTVQSAPGFDVSVNANNFPLRTHFTPSSPFTLTASKGSSTFALSGAIDFKTVVGSSFVAVHSAVNLSGNTSIYTAAGGMDPGTGPGIASRGINNIEVLATSGGQIEIKTLTPTAGWSGWSPMPALPAGIVAVTSPAAVSWDSTRTDAFVVASNGSLQHAYRNTGGWSGWESLGCCFDSAPTVAAWQSGRLDIFAKSGSGLRHLWYQGGWGSWETLGWAGSITSAPSAVSWSPGRIDIVARSTSGSVTHVWYNNAWYGPEDLGGSIMTAPGISSWGVNHLDIFGVTASGHTNTVEYNNGWTSWGDLLGTATSAPQAVSWSANRIDLVTRGALGDLQHIWFNGNWHWETL